MTVIAPDPALAGDLAPARLAPLRRRRPVLAAASAGLVALSVVAFTSLYDQARRGTAVLTVTRPVAAGARVTPTDLGRTTVSGVAGLDVVPAAAATSVVGRHATQALAPGQLLAREDVTGAGGPPPGQAVVGVEVKPGQAPATPLAGGASVEVIETPTDDSGTSGPPTVLVEAASVVATAAAGDGSGQVVSLQVPRGDAPAVAAAGAAGQVALVAVGGGR